MNPWDMVEWTAAFCACLVMVGGVVLGGATLAAWLERRASRTDGKL